MARGERAAAAERRPWRQRRFDRWQRRSEHRRHRRLGHGRSRGRQWRQPGDAAPPKAARLRRGMPRRAKPAAMHRPSTAAVRIRPSTPGGGGETGPGAGCGGPGQGCCPGKLCNNGGCCIVSGGSARCQASGAACGGGFAGTCSNGSCGPDGMKCGASARAAAPPAAACAAPDRPAPARTTCAKPAAASASAAARRSATTTTTAAWSGPPARRAPAAPGGTPTPAPAADPDTGSRTSPPGQSGSRALRRSRPAFSPASALVYARCTGHRRYQRSSSFP